MRRGEVWGVTWTLCRRPVLDLGMAPVAEAEEEEEDDGPGWGSPDDAENVLLTDLYLWFYVDIY